MELCSRDDAIARGLKRYYTGLPCSRGHVTERFVKGYLCYGCSDERASTWRVLDNPRKDLVDAAYRAVNRETLRANAAQKYRESPEHRAKCKLLSLKRQKLKSAEIKAYLREYAVLHKAQGKINQKRWRQANKAICNFWTSLRRAAIRNATPSWADPEAILAVYIHADKMTQLTGVPHEVDHYYPLRGELVCGLHVADNLRVLSEFDNRSKGNKMPEEPQP